MRKVITTTFVTMDGVMQGEHMTEQDTLEGFKQGDWAAKFDDDKLVEQVMDDFMKIPFELLLGRKTYEIWAAYWPYAGTAEAPNVARPFNATKKYVVSHASSELSWANSVMVTGEVVSQIKKLKEMDGPDLWVWGSSNLIQTLLKNDLVDQMYIWTYPLTVGEGKRLFSGGSIPAAFKLAESKISPGGIIIATYERSAS